MILLVLALSAGFYWTDYVEAKQALVCQVTEL